MGDCSLIETGVDKLVTLIRKNKKLSVAEAAKQLGVSTVVVEEWADFLEEEGIISIEYKFTTPYLVERLLTKDELVKKEKEFGGKKEAFVRKAEVALALLDRESETFQKIREQFDGLKKDLGTEIKKVKGDLKDLEKYEELKNRLDQQIQSQQKEFKESISQVESQISREQKKYSEILKDIDLEEKQLDKEKLEALSIRERENLLMQKLAEFRKGIEKIEKSIESEDKVVSSSEEHISRLKELADSVKQSVEERRSELEKLFEQKKEQEKNIARMQEEILAKAKEKKSEIDARVQDGQGASHQFSVFFDKKARVEAMLKKLNDERNDLEKELIHLIQKAKAFSIASKSAAVGKHMSELKKTFDSIDKKKGLFETELKKLASFLKS